MKANIKIIFWEQIDDEKVMKLVTFYQVMTILLFVFNMTVPGFTISLMMTTFNFIIWRSHTKWKKTQRDKDEEGKRLKGVKRMKVNRVML